MGLTLKSGGDRDSVRIAGQRTRKDWQDLERKIQAAIIAKDQEKVMLLFKEASRDFLIKRIDTRYFRPINAIKRIKVPSGQGFAIVAILCSLIEFLQTLRDGVIFEEGGAPYEDACKVEPHKHKSASKTIYKKFLDEFLKDVSSKKNDTSDRPLDFYTQVRCAILHNAMVDHPWVIHADGPKGCLVKTTGEQIILYCNELVRRLRKYIDEYCKVLLTDQALQAAFIRKFNSL